MAKFDDLPIEIQKLILVQQQGCGNPRNEEIFRTNICACGYQGGFDWRYARSPKTLGERETYDFWRKILVLGEVEEFFKIYGMKNEVIEQNGIKFVL